MNRKLPAFVKAELFGIYSANLSEAFRLGCFLKEDDVPVLLVVLVSEITHCLRTESLERLKQTVKIFSTAISGAEVGVLSVEILKRKT